MSSDEPSSPTAVGRRLADDTRFSPTIICGLHNLGNTCYFNAGLQLLASAAPFVSGLSTVSQYASGEEAERHAALHPTHNASRRKLLQCTTQTLHDMQSGSHLAIAPRTLLSHFASLSPMFEGLNQQDCPEMVTALLSHLEDETKVDVHVSDAMEELAASPAPQDPSSARYLAMLRLMNDVNRSNAEEEKEERHQRGQVQYRAEDYRPPTITRGSAVDCFRGNMLHEITCKSCQHVSRTTAEFTSLTVDIPTSKQRAAYAARHPNVQRYDVDGSLLNGDAARTKAPSSGWQWWNPMRYIAATCAFLYACCFGEQDPPYALTLEECLDIYFHEELLSGANRYRCPKCRQHVDATKEHSILWFPEYMMIHIKRFEMGSYWTTKRHDAVIFPVGSDDNMDVPSIPPHSPTGCSTPPPAMRHAQFGAYGTEALKGTPAVSTYDLVGVANHHGSFGGGHYTAYAHKGASLGWVRCNDERVTRVLATEVADSQEYLLLYRKRSARAQAVTPSSPPLRGGDNKYASSSSFGSAADTAETAARLALRAREILAADTTATRSSTSDAAPQETTMVSKSWLHRVATFVEPGPLLNQMCYCRSRHKELGSAATGSAPHFHGTALGYYAQVPSVDYATLVNFFGGAPTADAIRPEAYEQALVAERNAMRRR